MRVQDNRPDDGVGIDEVKLILPHKDVHARPPELAPPGVPAHKNVHGFWVLAHKPAHTHNCSHLAEPGLPVCAPASNQANDMRGDVMLVGTR